jgi:SAM-dependent methyltransferase
MADDSYNRLILKMLRAAVTRRVTQYCTGRLVDVGCGDKPYAEITRPFVSEHVGVDYAGALDLAGVDIVATAYDIPVPDASFDCLLLTEVLEHLEEPVQALTECCRILRPGGIGIITVPFMWHLHAEPRDFFRYSAFGLRHVVERAGLEVVELDSLGGFWTTTGEFAVYNLIKIRHRFLRPLAPLLTRPILWAAERLERLSPRPRWASHQVAVVRKPLATDPEPAHQAARAEP